MEYLELKKELRRKIQERMDYMKDYTDVEVEEAIDEAITGQKDLVACPVEMRRRLRKELFDSLRRLDLLQIFVEDSTVTEIMVNGKDHIFVERGGGLQELDIAFESTEKLQDVIQQIVSGCNRVVNEASPIVDARLSDGSRVNIVMNPIAYFSNHREVDWFNDMFVREMIMGIDRAEVIRDEAILKENGRGITPEQLAGGTQTLICIYKNPDTMFYGEPMGDNCIPFLMRISEMYDINLLLEHFMGFRDEDFNNFKVDGVTVDYNGYLEAFADFSERCYGNSWG